MAMTPPFPPLAELHRHLDGSMRQETLHDLAREQGREIPGELGFWPGVGLQAALAQFEITLSVLQQPAAVERVASEMCEDAEREGITTLEIRFAPQLHREASIASIVDAAVAGAAGRAGIILCGLYGEPPDLLFELVEVASSRPGVVGLDLAGGPGPAHEWSMADYEPAFSRARSLGIGRTVHAGEDHRPPSEIRMAIEVLHAQRIGHGISLLEDPSVVGLVLERGVTIEACPTSNHQTGSIASVAEHPIRQWMERGIPVSVCTDNTLLSRVDLPGELRRVMDEAGVDRAGIETCIAAGQAAAFRR